jgi:TolA-binding protein
LKRLETNSEYKADYTFAINNLLICYSKMEMPDDALNYVDEIRDNEKSSQEDKFETGLFAGYAHLQKGDTTAAIKEFEYTVKNTKTVAAAEAKYNIARVQYLKHRYKESQKTCFELVKDLPNYDYWVTKTFILLADDYVALKDKFQARATLQSVIDNYKGNDDIIPEAKQKLDQLSPGHKTEIKSDTDNEQQPDTTSKQQPDTSGVKKQDNKE